MNSRGKCRENLSNLVQLQDVMDCAEPEFATNASARAKAATTDRAHASADTIPSGKPTRATSLTGTKGARIRSRRTQAEQSRPLSITSSLTAETNLFGLILEIINRYARL